MLRIGVTGGIGSGKSTAAKYFNDFFQAELIDADDIARRLTAKNGAALPKIREVFGDSIFNKDFSLNRDVLRKQIFDSTDSRKLLEGIIHPLVRSEIFQRDQRASAIGASIAVFDIPLLIEDISWRTFLDKIVVIDCCKSTQIQRVFSRSGILAEDAAAIISAQATRADRLSASDAVIYNGGRSTLDEFRSSVQELGAIWLQSSRLK